MKDRVEDGGSEWVRGVAPGPDTIFTKIFSITAWNLSSRLPNKSLEQTLKSHHQDHLPSIRRDESLMCSLQKFFKAILNHFQLLHDWLTRQGVSRADVGWSDRLGWVHWLTLNNRRQSIGPKPDSRPRLEGARYKYLKSCYSPLLTLQSCTHSHTSLTRLLPSWVNAMGLL